MSTPAMSYENFMNNIDARYNPSHALENLGIYIPGSRDSAKRIIGAFMSTSFWQSIQKMAFGNNVKDYILGCRFYYGLNGYVKKYPNNTTPTLYDVTLGDHVLKDSSDITVQCAAAKEGFVKWSTGYLEVPHVYKAVIQGSGYTGYRYGEPYLDYLAHYQLYLPYYGFIDLSPTDVVGGQLRVVYNIDLVTGATVIDVLCYNPERYSMNQQQVNGYEFVICSLTTKVGVDIPINVGVSQNASVFGMLAATQAFKTGASLGISMGSSEASAALANAQSKFDTAKQAYNDIKNNPNAEQIDIDNARRRYGTADKNLRSTEKLTSNYQAFAPAVQQSINLSAPNGVTRSNGFSESHASLSCLYPYLLISKPNPVNPTYSLSQARGQHVNMTIQLNGCHGFTQIDSLIPRRNSTAPTPKYAAKIIDILRQGVYLKDKGTDTDYPPAPTPSS